MKPPVEVQGVLHVHSAHSDGSGSVHEIIEAAQGAEIDFLILTDHNTMQAKIEGWEGWHGSTLFMVGEEISTQSGHCLAIGTSEHTGHGSNRSFGRPRSAGETLRDIRRQGGLSFIAHPHGLYKPFFMRRDHSWKDWSINSYNGLEIWSYMFDWASRFRKRRWKVCLQDPDALIGGPDPKTLEKWDEIGRKTRLVGIGGVDAHAHRYPLINRIVFPYADLFHTVRTHVLLDRHVTGNSEIDKTSILHAIRTGHCFAAYEQLGQASGFRFSAPSEELEMGDEAKFQKDIELVVESPVAADFRLIRDGLLHTRGQGMRRVFKTSGPGVYRVEAFLEGRPWIFTNPVYLRD